MIDNCLGPHRALSRERISSLFLLVFPSSIRKPLTINSPMDMSGSKGIQAICVNIKSLVFSQL